MQVAGTHPLFKINLLVIRIVSDNCDTQGPLEPPWDLFVLAAGLIAITITSVGCKTIGTIALKALTPTTKV